jgi:ribokinase
MNPEIVVVGSYVQDLTWHCSAFPQPGETIVGTFRSGPGGKGSNQAVAAARAGAATLYIGAVGNDALGREAKAFYRAEKITARWATKKNAPTGTAGILVNSAGHNEIVVALGANAKLTRADVDEKSLAQARVVVTQLEAHLPTAVHTLRLGRKHGVLTVLNPAPMRADFKPAMLKLVDVLIPNETEVLALLRLLHVAAAPADEPTLAGLDLASLHALCGQLGVPVVILTLGRRGCLLSRKDGYVHHPAFLVEAVDTTGAGDAFVGGFVAGLIEHEGDMAAAIRFATAVAALSVTKPGTAPSMPSRRAINRQLKRG